MINGIWVSPASPNSHHSSPEEAPDIQKYSLWPEVSGARFLSGLRRIFAKSPLAGTRFCDTNRPQMPTIGIAATLIEEDCRDKHTLSNTLPNHAMRWENYESDQKSTQKYKHLVKPSGSKSRSKYLFSRTPWEDTKQTHSHSQCRPFTQNDH